MSDISTKLTYLNTTKGKIKDSINLTGANILSTDTFRSYATKLKNGLVDIINNGIDTLYDNFPKVVGEGTEIVLNNTYEAPLKINTIKGDTQQDSYSGKNLNKYPYNGGGNSNGITFTPNSDGTIILNGKNNGNGNSSYFFHNSSANPIVLDAGTYYIIPPDTSDVAFAMYDGTNYYDFTSGNNYRITFNQQVSIRLFYVQIFKGKTTTFTDEKIYPMLSTIPNQTKNDYEPYVGGPSPNPDYPQDVKVVTGSQSISVNGNNYPVSLYVNNTLIYQKNCTVTLDNDEFVFNATGTDIYFGDVSGQGSTYLETYGPLFEIPNNATTINIKVDSIFNKNFIQFYDANRTYISRYNTNTKEIPNNAKYVSVRIGKGDAVLGTTYRTKIIVYFDTQITTYTIDLGTLELCKIGNYQDTLQKSSGKNLFDKTATTTAGMINEEGTIGGSAGEYHTTDFIPIKPNTSYIMSGSAIVGGAPSRCYYDKNKNFISGIRHNNNNPFSNTSPSNAYYMRESIGIASLDSIQIEEGTSSTEYEPFGEVWYKKANIGKVILDGSESGWNFQARQNNVYRGYITIPNGSTSTGREIAISNYFYAKGGTDETVGNTFINSSQVFLYTDISTISAFKTWLSTHNTIVYYILETPTYEIITDTTLINQLESIKSKEGTTNITISGNLPMIINASALEKE